MDWHNEADEGLPTPRDDEPATLRQEILDELADHLHCALGRELSKNIAPEEAEKNVRQRFGDPSTIARRLWFDAMKEKIMTQRQNLAAIIILACTSIAASIFAWIAVRDSRAANAALLERLTTKMAAEMRRTDEVNAKMLNQLAALSAQNAKVQQSATPTDWCRVKFHFVKEHKGGPPLAGVHVRFDPYAVGGSANALPVYKTSDSNGDANCGFVHVGDYNAFLTSPFGDTYSMGIFEVRPGETYDREIACPAGPLQPANVRFHFEMPADLRDTPFWFALRIGERGRTYDGTNWTRTRNPYQGDQALLVVDPHGTIVSAFGKFGFAPDQATPGGADRSPKHASTKGAEPDLVCITENSDWRLFALAGSVPSDDTPVQWSTQQFFVFEVAVIRQESVGTEREEFTDALLKKRTFVYHKHQIIAYRALPGAPVYREVTPQNPAERLITALIPPGWEPSGYTTRRSVPNREPFQEFQPVAGKENVWNIPLPESFFAAMRAGIGGKEPTGERQKPKPASGSETLRKVFDSP